MASEGTPLSGFDWNLAPVGLGVAGPEFGRPPAHRRDLESSSPNLGVEPSAGIALVEVDLDPARPDSSIDS